MSELDEAKIEMKITLEDFTNGVCDFQTAFNDYLQNITRCLEFNSNPLISYSYRYCDNQSNFVNLDFRNSNLTLRKILTYLQIKVIF